jgi:lactoylglutathione lyase
MSLHTAFRLDTADEVVDAVDALRDAGVQPLDFLGRPTQEPVVLAWMPAISLYFRDPDGHMLEYLSVLSQEPRPDAGVVPWSQWPR